MRGQERERESRKAGEGRSVADLYEMLLGAVGSDQAENP